ncbi:hypothetical protein A2875_03810 [Candidatus Gottesmanbacteria bacterium RIFCSPHIGHO2_01_FULL_46_14]|uniref:Probable DNA 3'-5' helicase RecG n=3 Tax=Candidatus Gottesmaniibacteriota TaxID=1752720 RepID=A0A1F5ZT60_9BACT|nr:MAG: hypothetical protein A2875_03810 [Candidatus Gottesmanbacteria bacterium RIFCSPHIGHO2_01_FULL_46_14]OGG30139.1 MAG: hypothetical protein A2971_05405 [Candidatus Gottesmanbacteria bacterium RIFCSPLOWO2_01_FULL_46_21]
MNLTLDSPVQYVPRVGPAMAKRLENLDIKIVKDLLCHVPFRYNDFSLTVPVASAQPGEVVTISGTISGITNIFTKTGKKIQRTIISDDSGSLSVIWFNQLFLSRVFTAGDRVSLSGKIDWFGRDKTMISPEYEIGTTLHTGRLVPVYPETEGVSSKWLRGRIAFLLETLDIPESLPEDIRKKYDLLGLSEALGTIHFPKKIAETEIARKRLGFDELLLWQLKAKLDRATWEKTMHAIPLTVQQHDLISIIETLPFVLTTDQKKAIEDITRDVGKNIPMNRLLVGDVGSGKTVVAALAMYIALRNGNSSLLMAPTEILAKQHHETISALGLKPHLVTGSSKDLGDTGIYIGTHALLNTLATIPTIGLVIVDEQHRFGVRQRGTLTSIKPTPHLLTMTATPIPRTMAKVLFSNIDISVLSTLPSGRKKIKTWLTPKEKREKAYQWISEQIEKTGTQAFIICPFIEESETLSTVRAVTTEFKKLKDIFHSLSLGLLHGRMKTGGKDKVLSEFRHGKTDILVATPVVEVGIDIPNATIMMIEGAERFGLSQLHQLRGRVGRGTIESYCLLFTDNESEKITQRLKALETVFSGPELAEIDLKLRGPGDMTGTRQHGLPSLRIATLSDTTLIAQTQKAAEEILPNLDRFSDLRNALKKGILGTVQD